MVEFGLKLEDNKVADWAEFYIDYEKLKAILANLKTAIKKKEELFKRRPDLAKEIELAYEVSLGFEESFAASNEDHLTQITETAATPIVDFIPEQQPLLQKIGERIYGSDASLATREADGSTFRSLTGVGGNLTNPRFEKKVLEHIKQVENYHKMFEEALKKQVEKVNDFYLQKTEELDKRLTVLVDNVDGSDTSAGVELKKSDPKRQQQSSLDFMVTRFKSMVTNQEVPPEPIKSKKLLQEDEHEDVLKDECLITEFRESESVQRALGDQYRSCKLLHNFSIMNYTGFVKIVKKFDKMCPGHKGKYKEATKEAYICNEGKEVEELEERMEFVYASWFCDGNTREARAQLLPKRGDGLQMDWSQLRLGYRLGMCAILTLWVCWDCVWGLVRDGNSTIGSRHAFPVFRACGGLLLLHWFWGMSVYVWTRFRINYIFLFDLDPKTVSSPISIFNDAVDESLVFLVLTLLYYKAGAHDIPSWIPEGYYPAFLVFYTICCLIFPLRTRMPMWLTIFDVLMAPLTSPTFFTIYIADVFTSMVKVFQDVAWTIGFIVSCDFLKLEHDQGMHKWQQSFWYKNVLIPLICLFPLWIRFNQCLRKYTDTGKRMPNLANALKYAMSQTVTLFGAFHPLYLMHKPIQDDGIQWFQIFWVALFVSSSLYSFWWDLYMDWGLGSLSDGFLSPVLMYSRRSYYYCAIGLDIVLRFMWVLTLVPPQSGASFAIPQYLSAVTMSLELMRRTMWGFFRLENEHRSNTNQYRRVSFVPLHFQTGHKHKYNEGREHVGWTVLLEVAVVTLVVIGISVTSVIAAQRATRDDNIIRDDNIVKDL